MLVAWFRQKYPHLTAGGIASSAPIDFYPRDGRQRAFWEATMHSFSKFGSATCPSELKTAMEKLQEKTQSCEGREEISKALGSCQPLHNETSAGSKVDFFIRGVASTLAMLDYPVATNFLTPLPANPVKVACEGLGQSPDALSGLRSLLDLFLNTSHGYRCYDFMAEMVGRPTQGDLEGPVKPPDMGHWQYQACNEMPMQSLTSDGMGFYPASDDQLLEVAESCETRYGFAPRTFWLPLSFGGSNLQVGQLLFTNGEKDPWRVGAPKAEKLSEGLDIVQHLISAGAHHEDLRFDADPPKAPVSAAKAQALASMKRWTARWTRSERAERIRSTEALFA
ncbi:Dipeptidyl peptidase 2 (Dipeptidyl aminopeptidase II) (Dipeptidyl peptidase 7) (Dipeptidyl peptidase II) (DPP II) (Quiescent cell proline dipeptidase) [Durusdinium trenchii]|uniref:Dipeptidyl peptidase 2 (Dipeptidyl aminopeptidase II) (Dipeptidyl peptidase 7) (Dipeptidyl peptidase II) (DPP II) (Quiescent cell proline dipeptidase) n=1 Tax=Durusdinium trenchii TaxID=1381693 RepID=A0ABP0SCE1_9DINO